MATPLATAFVEIRPYTKAFGKQLKEQMASDGAAAAETSGAAAGEKYVAGMKSKILKAAKGITVGLFAAGGAMAVAGIDMASKFNSEMELLATQAGVAQPKVDALKNGVLKLAGQVGFAPDSLAESLFHVESNFASLGITGPKALSLVKIAAEGAATGHADLVDVTNALTAAVASGIPGVQNFSKAMGVLNSTVGAGDMKMEDLAGAFGTGLLASVKGFGLSIKDVGAALDVFGDNNIRGAKAGTELRMAVQALAAPTAQGAKSLIAMGISSGSLAKAMQQGGLKLALETLISHMRKAGITATQEGQVLTNVFGKKAGVGIQILTGQMDRFLSKYPALDKGAKSFGTAWTRTQETTAQKLKDLQSGFGALEVKIGEKLIPVVLKLFDWIQSHTRLVAGLAIGVAGLAVSITVVTKTIAAVRAVAAVFAFLRTTVIGAAVATRVAAAAGALYDGVLAASATAMVAFQDAAIGAKIAILAQAVASRVAAAAQFLFDAAMDANPVGLVVIAVAALIGGLYELFKHVTIVREIFADVFDWIKDHWKLLLPILLGPIGIAIDLIATYWHQIIHGVADVISWIAGHWKLLLAIFLGPVGIVVDIIVTQWKHIEHAFADLWQWIWTDFALKIGGFFTRTLPQWFRDATGFLERYYVKPYEAAFAFLWHYVWTDFGAKILGFFTRTLPSWFGAAVHFVRQRLVLPAEAGFALLWHYVWGDFGAKILGFFTRTVPGWFDDAVGFVRTRLIQPQEQAFSQLWQWIWTDFGQKIFNFLTTTLPGWFEDAVHAIGRAWTDIENAVKIPVNWVIQYVYDDGIRKIWNFIANLAGLPDLVPVATLAEGGRIPGFGGGDRHPALLEGGEAVIDKHRTKALAPLFSAIGVPGFAKGGLVGDKGMTGTSQAQHAGGLLGGIGDTFRIMAALATGNKVALAHAFEDLFPSPGGSGAKPGSGIFRAVVELPAVMVTDLVAKAIKAFAESGNAIVAYAESFIGKVPYVWGGTSLTSGVDCSGFVMRVLEHFGYDPPRTAAEQQAWAQKTGSPVPGGLAFFAGADGTAQNAGHVGIVTGPNQMVDAFGTGFGVRLNTLFGSSGANGGFGIPPGGFGNRPGLVGNRFDSGGWLPPGISLAINGTGRPERVLGPGASSGGADLDDVCGLLSDLISVMSAAPGATAGALGGVLGTGARRAGYRAMYSAR